MSAKPQPHECWVHYYAQSSEDYWLEQDPQPRVESSNTQSWLVWPTHKFDPSTRNCLRCGQRLAPSV